MKKSKLLGLLLTCGLTSLFTFSAGAATLSEESYGSDSNESVTSICGGEGQKDCIGTPAVFEGSATGECPAG